MGIEQTGAIYRQNLLVRSADLFIILNSQNIYLAVSNLLVFANTM